MTGRQAGREDCSLEWGEVKKRWAEHGRVPTYSECSADRRAQLKNNACFAI